MSDNELLKVEGSYLFETNIDGLVIESVVLPNKAELYNCAFFSVYFLPSTPIPAPVSSNR